MGLHVGGALSGRRLQHPETTSPEEEGSRGTCMLEHKLFARLADCKRVTKRDGEELNTGKNTVGERLQ